MEHNKEHDIQNKSSENGSKIGKTEFFSSLAFEYFGEMRLLMRGGKLTEKEKWRNVAEHCLVEVACVKSLGKALGLSDKEVEDMATVAACHDWDKHLEKKPEDFSEEEKAEAQAFLLKANPDKALMSATKLEWIERAHSGEASFLEKLQFYVDEICDGSNIVSPEERIEMAESREHQEVNAEVQKKLGGKTYREAEREMAHSVENEIFLALRGRGTDIGQPENLPFFIKSEIEKNF